MTFVSAIKKICMPSKIYLGISMIVILIALLNKASVLSFIKMCLLTAFWTWNLQIICKSGYTNISWVLILLVILYQYLSYTSTREGYSMPTNWSGGTYSTSGIGSLANLSQSLGGSGGLISESVSTNVSTNVKKTT